jgi:dUTPase
MRTQRAEPDVPNQSLTVRIRRLAPHVTLPQYGTAGSAAFDLALSEDVTIAPGEVRLVPCSRGAALRSKRG